MKQFRYRALTEEGVVERGTFYASHREDALSCLSAKKLDVLSCYSFFIIWHKKVKFKDLMSFCVTLELFEKAKIPLLEGLNSLEKQATQKQGISVLKQIQTDLSKGALLSEALLKHPSSFDHVFCGLIQVGEKTGQLAQSLAYLKEHLRWIDETRAKTLKGLRYPFLILGVMGFALFSLFTFLVPPMTEFLLSLDQELPLMTRLLLTIQGFFISYGWEAGSLILILWSLGWIFYKISDRFQLRIEKIKLGIPFWGTLYRKIVLSRFLHFFSILMVNGFDILKSLEIATGAIENPLFKHTLIKVKGYIEQGLSLSQALEKVNLFPLLVTRMVKVGEETDQLADSLKNVEYFYARDVEESVESVVALIEPILMLSLGLILLWIAGSLFIPIYDNMVKMETG